MTLTDEDYEVLMDAVKEGFPPSMACGLIGLTPSDFHQLLCEDLDLRRRVLRWDAHGKYGIFKDLRAQAALGSVSAAKFLLERTAPEEFGPPKQVLEQRKISVNINQNVERSGPAFDLARLTKEELVQLQDLQRKALEGTMVLEAEVIDDPGNA